MTLSYVILTSNVLFVNSAIKVKFLISLRGECEGKGEKEGEEKGD